MNIDENKKFEKSFDLRGTNQSKEEEERSLNVLEADSFEDIKEDNQASSEEGKEEISEELILEEKRNDFAKLDLEASKWLKNKKRLNFWDKKDEDKSFTKDSYGESENSEYFEKKKEYIDALITYRESKLQELDSGNFSEEEKDQRRQEIIKETVHMEANRLYDIKTAMTLESKDDSFKEKAKEISGKAVEWYRGLSFKKKIAISASLMGAGVGAGMMGGATGVFLATGAFAGIKAQRVLSGAAATVGLEGWLHKRQEKKAEKEAVELFADRLKSRLKDLNEGMDEKMFELEGRKSSEIYKRYILSGTAGILVGSGAVGKAVFGTADFFGLNGDRVSELLDKTSEKVSGFFGSSEAYASEGVAEITEDFVDGQNDFGESIEVEGKYPSYEFTRLDFVTDDEGVILGIEYAGNFLNFNPASFIDVPSAEGSSSFGLEDKIKIEDSLKEIKIYQQAIESIQSKDEIKKEEYEWAKNTLNEKLEDLKANYGAFLKNDEIEKAFAVTDLPEIETETLEAKTDFEEATEAEPESLEEKTEVELKTPEEATTELENEFTVLSDKLEKETLEETLKTEEISKPEVDTTEPDVVEPETVTTEAPAPSPDTYGGVEFESSDFSTNIEAGSSVWSTTEELLKANFTDDFDSLNDAQKKHLINQIVNKVSENPAEFGLVGVEDIDKVEAGQVLDLSPLTEGETIDKMLDLTKESGEKTVTPEKAVVAQFENDLTETEIQEPPKPPETTIPEAPAPSPDTLGGVEFESSDFSTNIEAGSSVWSTTEELLKANFTDDFDSLNDAQKKHLINQIVNKVSENPAEFGLVGVEDIDKVEAGQILDLSSLMEGGTIEKFLDSAENLSQEDISNIVSNNEKIEDWITKNPNEALTSERVQEIISTAGEKFTEIDLETVNSLMEEYGIANNPDNVEVIKSILNTVELTDLTTTSKEALTTLYFENWNADDLSNDRVKETLSGFLGKSYEGNKYFFTDGGNISKESNGDVKILLKEIGLSEERKHELLITLSLDGSITMDGPSEEWSVEKKSLDSQSLGKIKSKVANFIKK